MKFYTVNEQCQGINDWGLPFPDVLYSCVLPAATDVQLVVPDLLAAGTIGGPKRFEAIIKYNVSKAAAGDNGVWMTVNSDATSGTPAVLPVAPSSGTLMNATGSELLAPNNPNCREVSPGSVLHFICAVANVSISVSFTQVQG